MTAPTEGPLALTVYEAADLLQIQYETALSLIHTGQLRAKKVGRIYRVPRKAIDEFLGDVDQPAGAA